MAKARGPSAGAVVGWIAALTAAVACSSSSHGGDSSDPNGAASSSGSSGGSSGSYAGSGSGEFASSGSTGGSTSGGSTGSGSTSGGSGTGPVSGDGGACLGASVLAALHKTNLMIGGQIDDSTTTAAPFDLRYEYISGGIFDGAAPCNSCASSCTTGGGAESCASGCSWWGCWQYDADPPGEYVRDFVSGCQSTTPPEIPMFSYYQIYQSSGVNQGADEVTMAATDVSFMTRYFADWRFLLKQIGQSAAILHIEPDFWGFAEQQGSNPHALGAAVATANSTDCAAMENSIAGMGTCMVAMVRKYAPNALVGLHASAWSTNTDVSMNTSASLDVAAQAQMTAAFLSACGEADADLVVVETSDRDAGYYQVVDMENVWWDATNATLPDFHQDFAWVTALTEALGKPALYWQTPFGNENMPNAYTKDDAGAVDGGQWKDNRVAYFFGHTNELAAAHVIGAAFGAGGADQTTDTNDGGNFIALSKAYYASTGGGQALCSP
jgi:hypothetical protein